jgi:hypothetical protein
VLAASFCRRVVVLVWLQHRNRSTICSLALRSYFLSLSMAVFILSLFQSLCASFANSFSLRSVSPFHCSPRVVAISSFDPFACRSAASVVRSQISHCRLQSLAVVLFVADVNRAASFHAFILSVFRSVRSSFLSSFSRFLVVLRFVSPFHYSPCCRHSSIDPFACRSASSLLFAHSSAVVSFVADVDRFFLFSLSYSRPFTACSCLISPINQC